MFTYFHEVDVVLSLVQFRSWIRCRLGVQVSAIRTMSILRLYVLFALRDRLRNSRFNLLIKGSNSWVCVRRGRGMLGRLPRAAPARTRSSRRPLKKRLVSVYISTAMRYLRLLASERDQSPKFAVAIGERAAIGSHCQRDTTGRSGKIIPTKSTP